MADEAFYLPIGSIDGGPDGDEFESTGATASPWDLALQHGGPPAALLVRAIERLDPDPDLPIARITVDFLGGIPQGLVTASARVVRPGRRIQLVEATLLAGGRPAVTATAWRIRRTPGSTADFDPPVTVPPVPPAPAGGTHFFPWVPTDWGYGRAVDWRFLAGGYDVPGPARVWTRVRIPLVAGEEASPVQRLLVVADSTNGLSGSRPMDEWFFIPPTTTVTVQRPPAGEWMLLETHSTTGPDGIGLAQGRVDDEQGLCAVVAQPLMVARR